MFFRNYRGGMSTKKPFFSDYNVGWLNSSSTEVVCQEILWSSRRESNLPLNTDKNNLIKHLFRFRAFVLFALKKKIEPFSPFTIRRKPFCRIRMCRTDSSGFLEKSYSIRCIVKGVLLCENVIHGFF